MQFETWLKTDMQEPLKVVELDTSLFGRDVNANIIGVEITDGGEPVTLTGDVHGYVIRSTGTTVPLNGTLSGNRAQIVLNESCYLDPGSISIAIKIGSTTVAACHGYVYRTETDTVVDPEHVIPSINEILEQIRQCELATAAATAAAGAANTAAGTANTAADDATLKASRAQSAANTANTAANRLNNLTVSAQEGSTANAQVSDVDNHKHIAFTLPVGATPNISVAITTRSPGTGATIDIDKESPHSPEAPLITFGIPQGEPGQVTNVNGENIPISSSDSTTIKAYIDAATAISTVIDALYPVGSTYISMNSTMPAVMTTGRTWEAITGDYVLRTITTGTAGAYASAGDTGSTTLTVSQIPSHTHALNYGTGSAANGTGGAYNLYLQGGASETTEARGGGQGHTHTAGMPKNVSVYMWKRTA